MNIPNTTQSIARTIPTLLTIAVGLTNLTSRSTTTAAEMAKQLTDRLTALGRAHDLVRPLPGVAMSTSLSEADHQNNEPLVQPRIVEEAQHIVLGWISVHRFAGACGEELGAGAGLGGALLKTMPQLLRLEAVSMASISPFKRATSAA